jgi:hypothetical protein
MITENESPVMPSTPARTFGFAVRLDAFWAECRNAGLYGEADIAERFRMDRATVRSNMTQPTCSDEFIAAALMVLPRAGFDDLFEIVCLP